MGRRKKNEDKKKCNVIRGEKININNKIDIK